MKSHKKYLSAAVVVVIQDGLVLGFQRLDTGEISLPGGAVEVGEEPRDAAIRECKEETGLDIALFDIPPFMEVSPPGNACTYLYCGYVIGGTLLSECPGEGKPLWVPLEKVIHGVYGEFNYRGLLHVRTELEKRV